MKYIKYINYLSIVSLILAVSCVNCAPIGSTKDQTNAPPEGNDEPFTTCRAIVDPVKCDKQETCGYFDGQCRPKTPAQLSKQQKDLEDQKVALESQLQQAKDAKEVAEIERLKKEQAQLEQKIKGQNKSVIEAISQEVTTNLTNFEKEVKAAKIQLDNDLTDPAKIAVAQKYLNKFKLNEFENNIESDKKNIDKFYEQMKSSDFSQQEFDKFSKEFNTTETQTTDAASLLTNMMKDYEKELASATSPPIGKNNEFNEKIIKEVAGFYTNRPGHKDIGQDKSVALSKRLYSQAIKNIEDVKKSLGDDAWKSLLKATLDNDKNFLTTLSKNAAARYLENAGNKMVLTPQAYLMMQMAKDLGEDFNTYLSNQEVQITESKKIMLHQVANAAWKMGGKNNLLINEFLAPFLAIKTPAVIPTADFNKVILAATSSGNNSVSYVLKTLDKASK